MLQYTIQRLLLMIPSVIGVTMLTFIGLRVLMPYSVVDQLLANYSSNDPELRDALAHELGLTGSLPGQYLRWAGVAWFYNGETGILKEISASPYSPAKALLERSSTERPLALSLASVAR